MMMAMTPRSMMTQTETQMCERAHRVAVVDVKAEALVVQVLAPAAAAAVDEVAVAAEAAAVRWGVRR